jgi:hypothetical protein
MLIYYEHTVYWQNYTGLFSPFELIGFVVMLGGGGAPKDRSQMPAHRS